MNEKHPIDELFAQALRDSQAAPPRSVWEGIARDRDRSGMARRMKRRVGGLVALLLLLGGGAAGYQILNNTAGKHGAAPAVAALPTDKLTRSSDAKTPATSTGVKDVNEPTALEGSFTSTTAGGAPGLKEAGRPAHVAGKPERTHRDASSSSSRSSTLPDVRGVPSHAQEGKAAANALSGDPGIAAKVSSFAPASGQKANGLITDLDHAAWDLPMLSPRPSTVTLPELLAPALAGGSAASYAIRRGHTWLGIQFEVAATSGEWVGGGGETQTLNTSETWLGRKEASLVIGREWISGWSAGLTLGASEQRSRFFYTHHEEGSSQTLADTTWTGTPMGPQTVYTWNIVATTWEEPGHDTRYSATNVYSCLQVAPEAGYRVNVGRWSLGARGGVTILIPVARKGNGLAATGDDTAELHVVPLQDPSLDQCFTPSLAWFAGANVGYRLSERISAHLLPTYEGPLPGNSHLLHPALSNAGGALRLVWHFHNASK